MRILSFYSVLLTGNVAGIAEFYHESLEMELTFESDWYISLKLEGGEGTFQLAILRFDHPTIPEEFRKRSQGIILNLEVENAATMYDRLITKKRLPVHLDIRDEPWGQRHFITSDPDDNLLDIIEPIQPSDAFLAQYTEGLQ